MRLQGFFESGPHDDGSAVTGHYFERASADPARAQAWVYTDSLSYAPGQMLRLYGMGSGAARLVIARDGLRPEVVIDTQIALHFAPSPADASVKGCGWPLVHAVEILQDWASGVYIITVTVPGHRSQGMFVLRSAKPVARTAMILTTGTWCAYNDWGGSNHYQGLCGPSGGDFSSEVSILRPWAEGFVAWPAGAPRIPHASPLLTRPRYPHMDYARTRGISKKYASSGWAAFERPFAMWCEAQGIGLDYLTQHDLHQDPGALDGYARALIVGHDEYWTWEMRDHLDAWVEAGGELARFGGNFYWQTRLSADLTTQICHKARAGEDDPMAGSARITSYWDDPRVGRPAVATMGLTGAAGVYAGWSRCAAHGTGGFVIFRPEHWVMAGTGLGYGDVLGAASKIFGYEVDGIDYVMTHGLPEAAAGAGLQGRLQIIGLSPATTLSHSTGPQDRDHFIGTYDAEDLALKVFGRVDAETLGRVSRGNGAMAEYRRGKGAVMNAGSCEWVAGLIARERPVEQVTRNILTGEWGGRDRGGFSPPSAQVRTPPLRIFGQM